MAIVRVIKSSRFTTVSNIIPEHKDLSFKAKGLLLYLLSRPDGWTVHISQLAKLTPHDGISAVTSGMHELVRAGYATFDQPRQNGGKFAQGGWTIYEEATLEDSQNEPYCDFPCTEKPSTENRMLLNTDGNKDGIKQRDLAKESSFPKKRYTAKPSSAFSDENAMSPQKLVDLYNTRKPPHLPAVLILSESRRKKAKQSLRQFPDQDFWIETFAEYQRSAFLRGEKNGNGHETFQADFDWLLTKGKDGTENCVKVHDGKYRDAAPKKPRLIL